MPLTAPFNMADALNAGAVAAGNTLNVRQMQGNMADAQVFRDTARQASNGPPGAVPQPGTQPQAQMPQGGAPVQGMPPPPAPPPGVGMNMSAATASPNTQAIHQLFSVETAGHQKGYSADYHAQLLEKAGYPEKAAAVRATAQSQIGAKLGMQTQVMDYISRAAPLVNDQQSLDALRSSLQAINLDPNMLPAEYNENTQRALQMVGIGAGKQAELMFKKMQLDETERHNRATEKTAAEKNTIDRDKAKKEGESTSAKKYRELVASGVPDQIAKATAYGGMRMVSDPLGLGAIIIDEISGKKVGEIKNGQWTTTPGTFGSDASGRPPFNPAMFQK